MRVHIIIPVHNRIESTLECLGCIKGQTYKDMTVTVIDDGSTDGTAKAVRESFPWVETLKGDGNLWWTGAMHMGVEHVLKKAGKDDFILAMNNDIAFGPGLAGSMVKGSLELGRAMIGALQREYRTREVMSRGEWLDWKEFRFCVARGPATDGERYNDRVNVLPGRALLIPVEVFGRIGNFDKARFPHYIADYDFTMRAFNSGARLAVYYEAEIFSKTELTGNSIKDPMRLLTLKEAYTQFFSIKSDNNLKDHIRFVLANSPARYKARIVSMLLIGALYRLKLLHPFTRTGLRV